MIQPPEACPNLQSSFSNKNYAAGARRSGDSMTITFSIVYELPKSRWGASHMPNRVPANWRAILNSMRSLWKSGVDTSLETVFYERLGKPENPYDRLNSW
jgi:hypothetical protein